MFLERHNKTKLLPASFSYYLNSCDCYNLSALQRNQLNYFIYIALAKKEAQISRKKSNKEDLKVIKNTLPNIS